jgi:hypothetical protein
VVLKEIKQSSAIQVVLGDSSGARRFKWCSAIKVVLGD